MGSPQPYEIHQGSAPSPQGATGGAVAVWVDDRFLLDRVRGLLATGGVSVQTPAEPPERLVENPLAAAPDVAVLGAKRADSETLNRIRLLRSSFPAAGIVFVSERVANGDIRKALDAGADGIIATAQVDDALAITVQAVAAGQVVVPQGSREQVQKPVLTTREKQILGLVVMGMSNGEIASQLFLAESTVKSHLSAGFAKLGVGSRNEAVTLILDPERGRGLGILTIPAEPIATPG